MAKHTRLVSQQALALVLLNWLISPLIVLGQSQLRVVHLLSYSDQPVELELKIADEVIIADKSFVAIDDWLKDLSWRLKNASDKSIVCIEVELDFHGLGRSRAERVYTVRYGQKPDAQDAVGEPKRLNPDETTNFKLSDAQYNEIKQFVEQKEPGEGVSTVMSVVEMKIATVFFDDKSIWKDGSMLRSSPSNQKSMSRAGTWTPLNFSPDEGAARAEKHYGGTVLVHDMVRMPGRILSPYSPLTREVV